MAVMGTIAREPEAETLGPLSAHSSPYRIANSHTETLEFKAVFHGHELTRKDYRISCGILSVDNLIGGGIVRGRISEIIGPPSTGKTSLAAAFAAHITRSQAAAWIDSSNNFDPASIAAAGVELSRVLWVSCQQAEVARAATSESFAYKARVPTASLKAAEWILTAGEFGLIILDFGSNPPQLPHSAMLRLARAAERCGAGVLVLAPRRLCGTFAVLTLTLRCKRACFSRLWTGGPTLFEALRLEAFVARNKLGGSGRTAEWRAAIENARWSSAEPRSAETQPRAQYAETISLSTASHDRFR
jgi:hypothetical protein